MDDTVASGRRIIDRDAMLSIRPEVIARLALGPMDTLLDIGSGIGTLTCTLADFVRSVTAVDHADVLARMPNRPNVEKLSGDFLTLDMGERRYSRILAYSMLHYVGSVAEVNALIDKALGLLLPEGLMLLGDVPNDDLRKRNATTASGQRLCLVLGLRMVGAEDERHKMEAALEEPPELPGVEFNDGVLLGILARVRAAGHHAWLMRQPGSLPFAHAREDVVIQKLEPAVVRDLFVSRFDGEAGAGCIGLSIREVHPADCDWIYALSQEPGVRAASIRSGTFPIEEHRAWFARKMEQYRSGGLRWYVLEEMAQMPIGLVRYESVKAGAPLWSGGPAAEQDGGTEVSIALAPQARGHGMGALLLHRTEPHARKDLPSPLIALIKPDNGGSIKTFERAGYKRVGEEERMGVKLERWER